MDWTRVAVPLLGICAVASFAMLLASESFVQSLNRGAIDEEAFLQVARAGEANASVPDWGGPVATWDAATDGPLRDRPFPREETSRFVLPLAGWWGITDRFGEPRGEGRYHMGIDIGLAGWEASPVYSACDGVVVVATTHETYGTYVIVDCGDGWSTVSAHLSSLLVEVGEPVAAGETVLGRSGSTGLSTGEHLHFEVRYEGVPIDPELVLSFD